MVAVPPSRRRTSRVAGFEAEDAVIQQAVGTAATTTQHGAHPRQQLRHIKGFDEVVIRAAVEAAQAAVEVVTGGEDEDGRGAVAADVGKHVQPVLLRQPRSSRMQS